MEDAIKSTIHHSNNVIGETLLIFEELATLWGQIKDTLSALPLLNNNNNSYVDFVNILTPSFFLAGNASLSTSEVPIYNSKLLTHYLTLKNS